MTITSHEVTATNIAAMAVEESVVDGTTVINDHITNSNIGFEALYSTTGTPTWESEDSGATWLFRLAGIANGYQRINTTPNATADSLANYGYSSVLRFTQLDSTWQEDFISHGNYTTNAFASITSDDTAEDQNYQLKITGVGTNYSWAYNPLNNRIFVEDADPTDVSTEFRFAYGFWYDSTAATGTDEYESWLWLAVNGRMLATGKFDFGESGLSNRYNLCRPEYKTEANLEMATVATNANPIRVYEDDANLDYIRDVEEFAGHYDDGTYWSMWRQVLNGVTDAWDVALVDNNAADGFDPPSYRTWSAEVLSTNDYPRFVFSGEEGDTMTMTLRAAHAVGKPESYTGRDGTTTRVLRFPAFMVRDGYIEFKVELSESATRPIRVVVDGANNKVQYDNGSGVLADTNYVTNGGSAAPIPVNPTITDVDDEPQYELILFLRDNGQASYMGLHECTSDNTPTNRYYWDSELDFHADSGHTAGTDIDGFLNIEIAMRMGASGGSGGTGQTMEMAGIYTPPRFESNMTDSWAGTMVTLTASEGASKDREVIAATNVAPSSTNVVLKVLENQPVGGADFKDFHDGVNSFSRNGQTPAQFKARIGWVDENDYGSLRSLRGCRFNVLSNQPNDLWWPATATTRFAELVDACNANGIEISYATTPALDDRNDSEIGGDSQGLASDHEFYWMEDRILYNNSWMESYLRTNTFTDGPRHFISDIAANISPTEAQEDTGDLAFVDGSNIHTTSYGSGLFGQYYRSEFVEVTAVDRPNGISSGFANTSIARGSIAR